MPFTNHTSPECISRSSRALARLWPVLFGLLAVCVSLPCFAQSDAETEIARERFKEGVAHYDNQQFDKARLAFLQAYALKPHSAVLLNLAQSELRAGRFAEAASNFDEYIRNNPAAPAMAHAREALAEARLQIAEVNIGVSVSEATVMLDGAEIGFSPLSRAVFVMPGSHVVSARVGSISAEQVLQATAGQEVYISLEVAPPPSQLLQTTPNAAVDSSPARSNSLAPVTDFSDDDVAQPGFIGWLGRSPGAIAAVTVGVFGLTTSAVLGGFANSEYASAQNVKDVITSQIEEDASGNLLLPNVSACRQLAAGEGFSSAATNPVRQQRSNEYKTSCELFSSNSDSGDRLKTLAYVGLGVGVAATLGTIAWYITQESGLLSGQAFTPQKVAKAPIIRTAFAPIITAETQGLSFRLNF